MTFKNKSLNLISRDWVIGLVILVIFLLTNGYTLGWDDQHLEIPLLKSLIDPGLYQGDYYVESLKGNFTSYLYPILARVISIKQIPAAYLFLFLLSRYFLFLFIFKLWNLIARDKLTAFFCAVMIILLGRVEEFLYRTFSHQEFALAIIFVGIYFFYKERFVLAAAILGIAANFHALYSLFPFIYLSCYLVLFHKNKRFVYLGKSILAFILFASPLIVWIIQKRISLIGVVDTSIYKDWLSLYKIACPQNFILYDNSLKEVLSSPTLLMKMTLTYWFLMSFALVNFFFNEGFRKDLKSQAVIYSGFGLILLSFFFTYIIPVRSILDLNLIRNAQYILFILMGYTTLLLINIMRTEKIWIAVPFIFAFTFIRFGEHIALYAGGLIFFLLGLKNWGLKYNKPFRSFRAYLFITGMILCLLGIARVFQAHAFSPSAMMGLMATFALILVVSLIYSFAKSPSNKYLLRNILIAVPFTVSFINLIYYHHQHIKIEATGGGFWQLQRNWIDMQKYVRDNVPQEALLLVPYDMEMGGFRIFSERKVLVCYRDCGIVGFDYEAAKEWQQRIKDIEPFKVIITDAITPALTNAIVKYRVNYIVFMRYINPGTNSLLEYLYSNETFALYKVKLNPLLKP